MCKECNKKLSTESIKALGHTYGTLQTEKEATCTEDGFGYKKCERCEETQEIKLDALGHKFAKVIVERAASCTEEGYGYRPCEQCEERKEVTYAKLGHEYGEVVIAVEPTCLEKGTSYRPCIRCEDSKDDTEIPALGHEYGELIVEVKATCMHTGSGYQPCIRCNDAQLLEIPILLHQYTETVVLQEVTSYEEGICESICIACGNKIKEILPILSETHEHTFAEVQNMIEKATCEQHGIFHVSCTQEGCEAYKIIETPMVSHVFGPWNITKEATEDEEGRKVRKCNACQLQEELSIQRLPKTLAPILVEDEKTEEPKVYDWRVIIGFSVTSLVGFLLCIRSILKMKRKRKRK